MADILTKLISDVHIKMSIKQLSLGSTVADILIPVESADATETSAKLYYDAEDVATDFGADSKVYKKVDAAFSQDNFRGPIAIVTTPAGETEVKTTGAEVPGNVTASATDDGAEIATGATSTVKVSGTLKALIDYLWFGARYVILPDDDQTDLIKEVGKYLFDNQHMILVSSVSSIENLQAVYDEAKDWQAANHLGTTIVIVNKNEGEYVDISAAAFATQNIPLDWMHVRNLNGVTANKWSADEYQQIFDLNGLTTVNKAGDIMLSNSKTVEGSYIDNTFGAQYLNDALQSGLQKFLNAHPLVAFDDNNISLIKQQAKSIMDDVGKVGLLQNGADGKPTYDVQAVNRAQTPNADVVKRKYNGLGVTAELVGSVETLNVFVGVTL